MHNTRLTYTPPPSSIQIHVFDRTSPLNRLCARQTPKLRIGRTLSMAPVAIFFVRDAQMHQAFDNWSGTNDISFARCVAYRFTSFRIVRRLQTLKDIVTNPAITAIESRNRYIYIWSRNISKKLESSFVTSQWKFLSNLANYAVTFARKELEKGSPPL